MSHGYALLLEPSVAVAAPTGRRSFASPKSGPWAANAAAVDPAYQSLWNQLLTFMPMDDDAIFNADNQEFRHFGGSRPPFWNVETNGTASPVVTPFGRGLKFGTTINNNEGIRVPVRSGYITVGDRYDWSLAILFSWDGDQEDEKSLLSQSNVSANENNGLRIRLDVTASEPISIEDPSVSFATNIVNTDDWVIFYLQGSNQDAATEFESMTLNYTTGEFQRNQPTSTRSFGTDDSVFKWGAQTNGDDADGLVIAGTWLWNRRLLRGEVDTLFADPFGMYRPEVILEVAPAGPTETVLPHFASMIGA